MRCRRRRKKNIARVSRTAPAAAPVATPAIVPFAACFSGVMGMRVEAVGARVEVAGKGLEVEVEVDEVVWDDVWVVEGIGRVAGVVCRWGS